MPTHQPAKNLTVYYRDPCPTHLKPVVLLHGLGADGSSWTFQLPALEAGGFRPIAPDARGFGRSTYPKARHTIRNLAEDVVGLLRHLDCGPTDVIGISLGGMTGLQLALDYPDIVRKLVLINTAAWVLPDDLKTTFYYSARLLFVLTVGINRQAHLVASRIFPYPEQEFFRQTLIDQIRTADPRAYRRTMLALTRFDVRGRLNELMLPTLVITGDRDTTIQPARQYKLADGITSAQRATIHGAGHALTVEKPDQVNTHILEFLRNT